MSGPRDDFSDLPPRLTLRQFFAQARPVDPSAPPPMYLRKPDPPPEPAPEFELPPPEKYPGPLFGEPFD